MQQIKRLHKVFDKLQLKYGDPKLDAIYGAGKIKNAGICLIFMNPTMKNVASNKKWKGIKAQWIGTKTVWNFLSKVDLFDNNLNQEIQKRTATEWTPDFTNKVYKNIFDNNLYITNLSKATQIDARPLSNKVFSEYLPHLKEEIVEVNPKIIISFGNQVSSILLNKNIKVSECRKKKYIFPINGKNYNVYPVYYPIGQGMRNIKKATEDLKYILEHLV